MKSIRIVSFLSFDRLQDNFLNQLTGFIFAGAWENIFSAHISKKNLIKSFGNAQSDYTLVTLMTGEPVSFFFVVACGAHGVHMGCTWVHMGCTWCAHGVHMVYKNLLNFSMEYGGVIYVSIIIK